MIEYLALNTFAGVGFTTLSWLCFIGMSSYCFYRLDSYDRIFLKSACIWVLSLLCVILSLLYPSKAYYCFHTENPSKEFCEIYKMRVKNTNRF